MALPVLMGLLDLRANEVHKDPLAKMVSKVPLDHLAKVDRVAVRAHVDLQEIVEPLECQVHLVPMEKMVNADHVVAKVTKVPVAIVGLKVSEVLSARKEIKETREHQDHLAHQAHQDNKAHAVLVVQGVRLDLVDLKVLLVTQVARENKDLKEQLEHQV